MGSNSFKKLIPLEVCRLLYFLRHLYWEIKVLCVVHIVHEKALKECEELTKKDSEMTAKNEQLTQECRRYLEEFKRMEELIENLKREIDQRNRQASFAY